MKHLLATLVAATSLSLVTASVDFSSIKTRSDPQIVPGAYIVELDQLVDGLGRRSGEDAHEALYASLNKRKAKWSLRRQYKSPGIFVGASVNVATEKDLSKLADTPHVVSISPVYRRPRPKPAAVSKAAGATSAHPLDSFGPHVMTGVDKLHAEGIFGNGIKAGIIDTGVDYLHPALGGGFGPGYKVSHGTDLVGDSFNGYNDPVPDNDPMDCDGHGTHVSGIFGANSNPFNFTGVAPQASIGMYKVFGCEGGTPNDIIISALLKAYHDGNDIISMSLGGSADGWSEASDGVVASRIASTGVVVTAASSNDGQYGAFYISSPATGQDVISVASVENTQLIVYKTQLSNGHASISYYSTDPLNIPGSLVIYALSTDTTNASDACSALPASTPDLSKYIVLIRRGGCTLTTKATNLIAAGAKYGLFYNNVDDPIYVDTPGFESALISAADGAYLVDQFVKKTGLKLTFPQVQPARVVSSPTGGLISSFSSYGPTWDLEFKSNVAAPGGNILSTLPRSQGSYGILSGTSMATPFTAGAAALILQKRGKTAANGLAVRGLLESTGKAVASSKNSGAALQTLAQAGAGLINVYEAVHTKTIVTPADLALNDTAHFNPAQTITIRNTSNKAQKYKITHVPAGTMEPFDSDQQAIEYPVPLDKHYAKVTFKPSELTVQPGKSAKFVATITPPTGVNAKIFPVYSGFFKVASTDETVQVSYMGVVGKMKDMKIFGRTTDYLQAPSPFLVNADDKIQRGTETYRWRNSTDYPIVIVRLLAGTPALHIDLVNADTKLTTRGLEAVNDMTPIERSARSHKQQHRRLAHNLREVSVADAAAALVDPKKLTARVSTATNTYAKVPVVGSLLEGVYWGRNTDGSVNDNGYRVYGPSTPAFMNGTAIPNGKYKILVRALKITGDPKEESDYEAWLSPVVVVDHAN